MYLDGGMDVLEHQVQSLPVPGAVTLKLYSPLPETHNKPVSCSYSCSLLWPALVDLLLPVLPVSLCLHHGVFVQPLHRHYVRLHLARHSDQPVQGLGHLDNTF